ncbi:MAG: hypothetical protein MI976_08640 [Pseudomonadales bacterium]|nr:hypothetical protein [Pseudomonadales bacterium]
MGYYRATCAVIYGLLMSLHATAHVADLLLDVPGQRLVLEREIKGISPEMLDWWWDNIDSNPRYQQLHPLENLSFEWLIPPSQPQHPGSSPGAVQRVTQLLSGQRVETEITWQTAPHAGDGAKPDHSLLASVKFPQQPQLAEGRIRYDYNRNKQGDGIYVRVTYVLPENIESAFPGYLDAMASHLEVELKNLADFLPDLFQEEFIEGELLTRGSYRIEQKGWLLKTVVVDQEIIGLTPFMLDWWWDNIDTTKRYMQWHPTAHLDFEWLAPPSQPNQLAYSVGAVQLVSEYIGPYKSNLLITWLDPAKIADEIEYTHWVYAKTDLKELQGILPQRMHHQYQFNETGNGIMMRSTFNIPAFFDFFMPKFSVRLAEHALQEMQMLQYFLPELFEREYGRWNQPLTNDQTPER